MILLNVCLVLFSLLCVALFAVLGQGKCRIICLLASTSALSFPDRRLSLSISQIVLTSARLLFVFNSFFGDGVGVGVGVVVVGMGGGVN